MKHMYALAAGDNGTAHNDFKPVIAAGEAAPSANDFRVESRLPKEGCFSFDALFVATPFGTTGGTNNSVGCRIIPFGIKKLLEGYPESAPKVLGPLDDRHMLYEPITKDGSAIRVCYKLRKLDPLPGAGRKKPIQYVPIDIEGNAHEHVTSIIADGVPMIVSVLLDSSGAAGLPELNSFVRVVNFSLGIGKQGTGCYLNVGALEASAHPALNALPIEDALAAVFPLGIQSLPTLQPLLTLRARLSELNESGCDRPKILKNRNERVRALGTPPVAVVRVEMAQQWSLSAAPENPHAAPTLLPVRGFPDMSGDAKNKGTFIFNLDNARSIYVPAVNGDSVKFRFQMYYLAYSNGRKFKLHDVTFWPRSFATLGITYPTFIEALLNYHPIPCELMLGVDFAQTPFIEENTPGRRPVGTPDGVIVPDVHLVVFKTAQYVERLGIPVSEEFVRQRYGVKGSVIKHRYAEIPSLKDTFNTLPVQLKLENAFGTDASFVQKGFAALDGGEYEIPDDMSRVVFRALPLFQLNTPLKKAPRADPYVSDLPEDLPLAVDMTTQEGDTFIQKTFPMEKLPADRNGWMMDAGAGRVIPRFLFFMLRLPSAEEEAARVALFKEKLAHYSAPFTGLADADLPETLDAWREANINFELPVGGGANNNNKKRALASVSDTTEPHPAETSPKKARESDEEPFDPTPY